MDLNVDVIDNETGEIYREGVTLKAARDFISKEMGKIVREDTHIEELDDIDGGGQMEVHDIYVDFPEETLMRIFWLTFICNLLVARASLNLLQMGQRYLIKT